MADAYASQIMNAELSFDCEYDDFDFIEGCYRLPDEDWQVFLFTRCPDWNTRGLVREVRTDVVWRSGITGVQGHLPKHEPLTPFVVAQLMGDALGVTWWTYVFGPDSLMLK